MLSTSLFVPNAKGISEGYEPCRVVRQHINTFVMETESGEQYFFFESHIKYYFDEVKEDAAMDAV